MQLEASYTTCVRIHILVCMCPHTKKKMQVVLAESVVAGCSAALLVRDKAKALMEHTQVSRTKNAARCRRILDMLHTRDAAY